MPAQTTVSSTVRRLANECGVDPLSVEDAYPCTSLQTAMLAASLHDYGQYVSHFVFDLSSTIHDSGAARRACELLYEKTAILRSRFLELNGRFFQVVTSEPLVWNEGSSVDDYLDQEKHRPVVLGQPLTRFGWIRTRDDEVHLVWSLHHCQYDEWSFDLMINDLNKYVKTPAEAIERPPFSKFIKFVSKVDGAASAKFWQTHLRDVTSCGKICPNANDADFRTSRSCEISHLLSVSPDSPYQFSELVTCAWTLLVAELSASSKVTFGSIMSGRTADVGGIADICGPTLTTIPWCCEVLRDATISQHLDRLRQARLEMLPYEQTGLTEYRKLAGSAVFDTLLTVRSPQVDGPPSGNPNDLQAQVPDKMDLSHPCRLYVAVELVEGRCKIKVSYDHQSIDSDPLGRAMDAMVNAIESLPVNLETRVDDFIRSMRVPQSLERAALATDDQQPPPASDTPNVTDLDPEIMNKVSHLVQTTMDVKNSADIGPSTTLSQLGMDSLTTVTFARQLNAAFEMSIPFKEIAGRNKSLGAVAKCVHRVLQGNHADGGSGHSMSLLDQAAKHSESLRAVGRTSPKKNVPSEGASTILLTGVTGYLGIEILRNCLVRREEDFILLVRCKNAADGFSRVKKSAEMARWSSSEIESLSRVKIWPSDLAQNNLGLSKEHWKILNDSDSPLQFKAIIHNGAKVDFFQTYGDLESTNVASTACLLEQTLRYQAPPNFVYVTGGRPCPLFADDVASTAHNLRDSAGYAQTKFVGEVLVHNTSDLHRSAGRQCRMSIVHPGAIIGGASTGVANTDDLVWRYVAASLSMGCYVPALPTKREWINITAVDSVAEAVASCGLDIGDSTMELSGAERHLVRQGLPIGQFWAAVIDALGDQGAVLEPVSEWEWLKELEADIDRKGQQQPLFSLSRLFLEGNIKGIGGLSPAAENQPGPEATVSIKTAVRSNVQYLASIGFFGDGGRSTGDVFSR